MHIFFPSLPSIRVWRKEFDWGMRFIFWRDTIHAVCLQFIRSYPCFPEFTQHCPVTTAQPGTTSLQPHFHKFLHFFSISAFSFSASLNNSSDNQLLRSIPTGTHPPLQNPTQLFSSQLQNSAPSVSLPILPVSYLTLSLCEMCNILPLFCPSFPCKLSGEAISPLVSTLQHN